MKSLTLDNKSSVTELTSQLLAEMQSPRIVAMELILTEACNLKCSYCFECSEDQKQKMNFFTAFAAVDFLIEASRNSEWISITFIGGEPVLCYDLIQEVVKYSHRKAEDASKRVSFNMTTNGSLLTEDQLRFFSQEGVRYCLSLDGFGEDNDRHRKDYRGKGTYANIAQKMPLFKKYQSWQGARMTVMPDTAINLSENIRNLHEELAINQFIIGFATGVDWLDQQIADYNQGLKGAFEYYLDQKIAMQSKRLKISLLEVGELNEAYLSEKKCTWGCGAGSGRLAVTPDGALHGCSKLAWGAGGSKSAALPLGCVNSGFAKWRNRLKLLNHSVKPRHKCKLCELASFCNGGCYAANYVETGNPYLPSDTYCKLIYAQKKASDYGRKRLKQLGVNSVNGKS